MRLLTKEIEKSLPPLGSTDGQGMEALARVKFFTPDSSWTWYAAEYDSKTRTFFGLVKGLDTELGYFRLEELEQVRGKLGLPVERDRRFLPRPLRELWDDDRI
jgi:hypothetical protein